MIEVKNLTRKYGDFIAVDGVSFSIKRKEIVGLLGHNGAGKTTIMKVLTGFLEPSDGKIVIAGEDLTENLHAVQGKLGYLPENMPIYPEMTVVEYLDYACSLRSIEKKKRQELIKDVIERTGLKEKALDPIFTLSKGYRQRAGVAQAIIHKPEILILDEPTNGLDPAQIHEMRNLIKELSENSTVIISTHIMQEVEALCDRVIILSRGKIVSDSSLADLQSSNRIRLCLGQRQDDALTCIKAMDGVLEVEVGQFDDSCTELFISTERETQVLCSEIARVVIEKDWLLSSIATQERSLETVFREINQ